MATRYTPYSFVCDCLEDARPDLDTRGHPEYTRMLGGFSRANNNHWDVERHEISPHTILGDLRRLQNLITELITWITTMSERHRDGAIYTNKERALESLRRLEGFEKLIRDVKGPGPWSPHGMPECLLLARLRPDLFWPKFWEWAGYVEINDQVHQTEIVAPQLGTFVRAMSPVLVQLRCRESEQERQRQRLWCRAGLDNAFLRGHIGSECLRTRYFQTALYESGLGGDYVPPQLP